MRAHTMNEKGRRDNFIALRAGTGAPVAPAFSAEDHGRNLSGANNICPPLFSAGWGANWKLLCTMKQHTREEHARLCKRHKKQPARRSLDHALPCARSKSSADALCGVCAGKCVVFVQLAEPKCGRFFNEVQLRWYTAAPCICAAGCYGARTWLSGGVLSTLCRFLGPSALSPRFRCLSRRFTSPRGWNPAGNQRLPLSGPHSRHAHL